MLSTSRTQALRSLQPRIKVKYFLDEEVEQMVQYMRTRAEEDTRRTFYHKRYELLTKVLLRTGARVSEALMLRPGDIDLQLSTITLVTLKKNQKKKDGTVKEASDFSKRDRKRLPKRVLPLHDKLKEAFMSYFLEQNINIKSEDLLFSMKRTTVNQYYDRMEEILGFKIYPHKFRHTLAVNALLDGVPLNVLQKWLAHSSLVVTSIYADVLSMDTSQYMNQIH